MKILIVDDSRAMRMIVKRCLRQAGYGSAEVSEAENGVEALGMLEADRPDLILCDWNMPEMSGIELLRSIREQGSQLRFGFVTSEGGEEVRKTAKEAGALFVLSKPFTPDAIQKALAPVFA